MTDTIAQLTQDQHNRRKHNPRNIGMIVNALQEVGAARSIVIDEFDNILAGNGTIEAAQLAGIERLKIVEADGEEIVAVRRRGLTDDQKRRLAILDNRSAELADWDLDQLLSDLDAGLDFDGIFGKAEIEELLKDLRGVGDADAEPKIDKAAELQEIWQTATGQLWTCAEHKIICGDCTDKAVVDRLMGAEKAELCLTDPPYGVSYADKNVFLNSIGRPNSIEKDIENDHQTVPEMAELWLKAFKTIYDYCDDGCPYYIFSPQGGELLMMMMMIEKAGWELKHSIIWVKQQFVLGRSDYHYKHEPILYGWKKGGHKFYGEKGECSVWEVDKPHKSDLHPTTKPVELYDRAIINSSQENEIVVDCFAGSGTILVACHNRNRKARAIEISAAYTAVCLQRFLDATGIMPELVTS